MLEPRLYRAAFVPALLAVIVAMFSLESRPPPLAQGLAADVLFDGGQAAATARQIAAVRDRRAGSPGDRTAARMVCDAFSRRGFAVGIQRFDEDGRRLVNVIARRAGRSRRQVVVVAARDAAGVPDAGASASDTAALIEIARVFEGRPSSKTLVLASVDGATLGELGATRLAGELGRPGLVDGVIVVSGLGNPVGRRPAIVAWFDDTARAGIGLQRTLAESLRQEGVPAASASGPFGQVARLAFPIGLGAQGPLGEQGYDAVRLAGDGELQGSSSTPPERIDGARLAALGRAALRTVTALDQGPAPRRGRTTYVTAVSQVIPGWVFSALAAALVLPALVAAVDAFARARRRREAVSPWLAHIGAGAVAGLLGLGLAKVLVLAGAVPDPPQAPVSPALYPLDAGRGVALAAIVAAAGLAWWGLRSLVRAADPDLRAPGRPGAAVAVALTLVLCALALWALNPFAALLLVPALHLWMLATLPDPRPPARARWIMVALGLLAPALLAVYWMFALGVGPLGGLWYLFALVTGGQAGLPQTVIGALLAAAFVTTLRVIRADTGDEPVPATTPSVRGPGSYAGPGSLGGTSSALRR